MQIFANGPIVASAVASGTLDVGIGSAITIANGAERGIPFVIIAPATLQTSKSPTGLMCTAKSSTIRGPKDLEGKTIAVSGLRQAGDLAVRVWLTKAGVDLGKVQIVETSFAEMGPGLERGTYAAANMSNPTLSRALKLDVIRCFADPYAAIAPTYMMGVWYTTRDFAQKNPDLVRKLAAVMLETGHWANTHPDETAVIVSRITKIDADTIRNETRPIFAESMTPADLQPQLDAAYKFGLLPHTMSASELLLR